MPAIPLVCPVCGSQDILEDTETKKGKTLYYCANTLCSIFGYLKLKKEFERAEPHGFH